MCLVRSERGRTGGLWRNNEQIHRDAWNPAYGRPATSGTGRLSTWSSLWWIFLPERGYVGPVRPEKLEWLEWTGQCELQQVAGDHGGLWRLLRLAEPRYTS